MIENVVKIIGQFKSWGGDWMAWDWLPKSLKNTGKKLQKVQENSKSMLRDQRNENRRKSIRKQLEKCWIKTRRKTNWLRNSWVRTTNMY